MVDSAILVKNRKEMSSDMMDKYGYIFCENCMKSRAFKFEVHHIMTRGRYPNHPKLHNKENLIILCTDCHNNMHRYPYMNQSLIDQRNLEEIFKNSN